MLVMVNLRNERGSCWQLCHPSRRDQHYYGASHGTKFHFGSSSSLWVGLSAKRECDYFATRRFEKCATVPAPTHNAIWPCPCPCLRSLTTSTGCGESRTYKRPLSPRTSIFTFVHSPGTRST